LNGLQHIAFAIVSEIPISSLLFTVSSSFLLSVVYIMSGEPRVLSHTQALLYKKAAVFPRGVVWVQNSHTLTLSLSRLKNWQRGAKQLNVINVGLFSSYVSSAEPVSRRVFTARVICVFVKGSSSLILPEAQCLGFKDLTRTLNTVVTAPALSRAR
jgi:hypothetical protein